MVAAEFVEAGLLFAASMSVVFVLVYTLVAPWWRSEMGRSIVAFDAAVFLALLPSSLHYVAGVNLRLAVWPWYDGASLIGAGLITVWRMVVIVRVQRSARASESISGS